MTHRSPRSLAVTAAVVVGALGFSATAGVPSRDPAWRQPARHVQGTTLTVLSGSVEASLDGKTYRSLPDGQTLDAGLVLRTRSGSSALITLYDGTEVALSPNARLNLSELESRPSAWELSLPELAYRFADQVRAKRGIVSTEHGTVPPSVGLIRG